MHAVIEMVWKFASGMEAVKWLEMAMRQQAGRKYWIF